MYENLNLFCTGYTYITLLESEPWYHLVRAQGNHEAGEKALQCIYFVYNNYVYDGQVHGKAKYQIHTIAA